jgi:proteasome assembly chaperone (PAC2) family protein
MTPGTTGLLRFRSHPKLQGGTLVLAFTGWMDGGDVSTGTVKRLVDLLGAKPFAEIDPEQFYILNFPGSMEIAALFRPHVEITEGLIESVDMPSSVFYCHEPAGLALFLGKEPNMHWRAFGDCVLHVAHEIGINRILFVGSFGGAVPHTREPRLFVTCSDAGVLAEMERYGVRRSVYKGPGSFTNYLMQKTPSAGLAMASLVAEIPGYLQGTNPMSIEAVTRRLAKMLKLRLDLDSLRSASTQWELQISAIVEQDQELARRVRELETDYDNELLARATDES